MSDKPCPFLVYFERPNLYVAFGIKTRLKYGDAATKASALKKAILLIISGDTPDFRDLPAIIVRYVLPCADEDLKLQKLVLLYLETVYKGHDVYGRVPPDTGLVRDYLIRNLEHRDEYIRGLTLRFVSRLAKAHHPHDVLLEPLLVESVVFNLYHRHRFARRHAYSAIFAIYFHLRPSLPHGVRQLLLPDDDDALDRVAHELNFERDAAALRNGFLMLCTCAPQRALDYLLANSDRVITEWPDIVQVVAITLIRRACCACGWDITEDQGKSLIGIIISLSACSNSSSVIYEAADVLLSLCFDDPVALCSAANAYFRLLFSPLIDNTDVKRIVLERMLELGSKHGSFVKIIGSPSANPNMVIIKSLPIQKEVPLVKLDTAQMHIDSIGTPGPNMMNIKSLPIAKKLLLVELPRKQQGDMVEESNGRDTQLMHTNDSGTKLTLAIHA